VTFCIVFASLATRVQAPTGGDAFRSFHPRVEFGEEWESHLIVVNVGQDAHPIRLLAYDTAGHFLTEIPQVHDGDVLAAAADRAARPTLA
jgi:hypothetical protein